MATVLHIAMSHMLLIYDPSDHELHRQQLVEKLALTVK